MASACIFFLDIIFHSASVFELCREDSTQVGCFRYESRQCFNSLCSINIFLDNTWYCTQYVSSINILSKGIGARDDKIRYAICFITPRTKNNFGNSMSVAFLSSLYVKICVFLGGSELIKQTSVPTPTRGNRWQHRKSVSTLSNHVQ